MAESEDIEVEEVPQEVKISLTVSLYILYILYTIYTIYYIYYIYIYYTIYIYIYIYTRRYGGG